MSIHILPSHISDQIAAGEVVERPASVVKELVENALDAGAKHIEVRIEQGGKKLIEVRDNGSGMDREDAAKCILRYATSKIQSIDDLFRIQSFGFRGEALAAICAVSRFELTTKKSGSLTGTHIKISGAMRPEISDTPANDGTIIRVQDLFYTTPARLAYLKTEDTENRAIFREIQNFALSNPHKSFKLFKDEKLTLDFPPTDKYQRMEQVLKNNATHLLPCSGASQSAKISGFVSRPGDCIASRKSQFLFVNGRTIEDHKISFAVREGYAQSAGIEKHLHPVFVLFLEIDPILMDVNVHPRKLEVKFSEPQEIFSLVKKSIATACAGNSLPLIKGGVGGGFYGAKTHPTTTSPYSPIRNFQKQSEIRDESPSLFQKSDSIGGETFPHLQLIGQVARHYIVAESSAGLYLFDQHALHERQRFEQFWNEWKKAKTRIQKLLTPQIFRFSEESVSLLHEHLSVLAELGFGVTFPRDDEIAISEVPQIFTQNELENVLEKLIEYFSSERIGESTPDILMRKLIEYKSCRGAVMFGDHLKPQEMQKLLDDFQTTEWRNLCPHGRPNHIFLPFEKLDKEFHR